jgi:hypothetical protein
MDEVHSDYDRKHGVTLPIYQNLISPSQAFDSLKNNLQIDSIAGFQLIDIAGTPTYQVSYWVKHGEHSMKHYQLVEAQSGKLRPALSENEAIEVANKMLKKPLKVKEVKYLTETNGHHEYRESALPAYSIHYESNNHLTAYVSAQLGTVVRFRNETWRVFDFLWMMHTMDYQSRDNISNILLKTFSILGLCTVISGFALYLASKRWW